MRKPRSGLYFCWSERVFPGCAPVPWAGFEPATPASGGLDTDWAAQWSDLHVCQQRRPIYQAVGQALGRQQILATSVALLAALDVRDLEWDSTDNRTEPGTSCLQAVGSVGHKRSPGR